MNKKLICLVSFVFALGMVTMVSAVELKVDFGDAGTLGDNDPPDVVGAWTEWAATSGSKTIDGITFTLSNGGLNNGPKVRHWESSGDNLTKDALSEEDPGSGGWYQIQITGLAEGAVYTMRSYHNNAWEPGSFPSGSVSMKLNGTEVDTCTVSDQQPYTNAGVCEHTFTASAGSDTFKWDFGQTAWFNGFILQAANPSVQFESATSGDLETVSPAELTVLLTNPEEGQTYTVDYEVTGGTATGGGVDYTLTPGTLTFNPGETVKTIEITIIDDGLDEDDETVEVTLSNVTGGEAELGSLAQHTYTIVDPRPAVAFDTADSSCPESIYIFYLPRKIGVSLSGAAESTVTVDYAVAGGTAIGGGVDYTLKAGPLSFAPGELTKYIEVTPVDDDLEEADETILLTLSNPSGAKLGASTEHTFTILDDDTGAQPPNKDLNNDGTVDFDDVVILLSHWLECTLNPPELCWQ